MLNIWKSADRKAKQMTENLGLVILRTGYVSYFLCLIVFSSVWGPLVHLQFAKLPTFQIFIRLFLTQLSSNFNQPVWTIC